MSISIRRRRAWIAGAIGVTIVLAVLMASPFRALADGPTAHAALINTGLEKVGVVRLIQQGDKVLVRVEASTLPPGFHGFHVHAGSACIDPATGNANFNLAGGHYNPDSTIHGEHAGDMPVLLVASDGTAEMRFKTDSFAVSSVIGRTIIVHAAPDNYANVPASRSYPTAPPGGVAGTHDAYHSHDPNQGGGFGPDNATKATGDAGGRTLCGAIQATS